MNVKFEDEEFEFDIEALSRSEAAYIYRQTELTIGGILTGLTELHPLALDALYWLMLKQNGKVRDIHKLPDYPALKFGEALIEAMAETMKSKEDKEGELDPTEAAIAASQA
jgi:hypothetical protein